MAGNNLIIVFLVLASASSVIGSCSVSYRTIQIYYIRCGFLNWGTCTAHRNIYRYRCCDGWTGPTCSTNIDECDPDPCVNGECQDGNHEYTCMCDDGWTGDTCDADMNECLSNPCKNGAACSHGHGTNQYNCTCSTGWTGHNCDIDMNECLSNPCKNGGECSHGHGTNQYNCTCSAGWAGDHCDIDINECLSNPCNNDGECSDGNNQYRCTCSAGWTGGNCDIDIEQPKQPDVKAGPSVVIKFDILPKYVTNVLIAIESGSTRNKRQSSSSDVISNSTIVANLTRSDIDESMSFTIGDDKTYGGYINRALVPGGTYSIRIAHASCTPEVDCAVVWSPSAIITVPDCSVVLCEELSPELNSLLSSSNDEGYDVMIIGGSVLVICIVAVFILAFIINRRLRGSRSRSPPKESSTPNEVYEEMDTQLVKESAQEDENVYEVEMEDTNNLEMEDTKNTDYDEVEGEDEELVYEDVNI